MKLIAVISLLGHLVYGGTSPATVSSEPEPQPWAQSGPRASEPSASAPSASPTPAAAAKLDEPEPQPW